jgi:hypothetical protein
VADVDRLDLPTAFCHRCRYGCTRYVYQNGVLSGLNFRGTHSTGGLCWIPPVLTFPMLIGFGLDYHIFLLSRVVEFRKRRFSDRDAVLYVAFDYHAR